MKKVHIITIEITEPGVDVIHDAEKVVNSLINSLCDGQCEDALYRIQEKYPGEQYTMTVIDGGDNET